VDLSAGARDGGGGGPKTSSCRRVSTGRTAPGAPRLAAAAASGLASLSARSLVCQCSRCALRHGTGGDRSAGGEATRWRSEAGGEGNGGCLAMVVVVVGRVAEARRRRRELGIYRRGRGAEGGWDSGGVGGSGRGGKRGGVAGRTMGRTGESCGRQARRGAFREPSLHSPRLPRASLWLISWLLPRG